MKYVMNDDDKFILIPQFMSHDIVIGASGFGYDRIKSAGLVQLYEARTTYDEPILKAECFGKSVSLKKESMPEDSDIISASFR